MDMKLVMILGLIMAIMFWTAIQSYKNTKQRQKDEEEKLKFEGDRVDTIEYRLRGIKPSGLVPAAMTLGSKQYEHAFIVGRLLKHETDNFRLDALHTYIELNFDKQLKRVVESGLKDWTLPQ